MIDNLFRGLFDTDMTVVITPAEFLTCLGVSLGIGLILAALYQYHTRYTRSFVVTLALLPAVVCVVIMMVNGNVAPVWRLPAPSAWCGSVPLPGTARKSVPSSWQWQPVSSPAWAIWAMPCSAPWCWAAPNCSSGC